MEEKKEVYAVITAESGEYNGVYGVYSNEKDAKLVERVKSISLDTCIEKLIIDGNPPVETCNFSISGIVYGTGGEFRTYLQETDESPSKIKFSVDKYYTPFTGERTSYIVSGVVPYNINEDPIVFQKRIKKQVNDEFKVWKAAEEKK